MTSQRTRDRLINRLADEGIYDTEVLEAIRGVPRHVFVDEALASRAYEDTALPIGHNQTISQPYIVALMTQALLTKGKLKKVLEVGTGSGYQTAILAELIDAVYTVERIEPLFKQARRLLMKLGYRNIHYKLFDCSWGWTEYAPYDGIIVTAAPASVPSALLDQLAVNGQMVIPVGGRSSQALLLVTRDDEGFHEQQLELVNFVPLI